MKTLHKLTAAEMRLFYWCNSYSRARLIEGSSRFISRSGDGYVYALTALLLYWLDQQNGGAFLSVGLQAYAVELPLYLLLKNTIQRTRPCNQIAGFSALIQPSDRFSFPSGHAAAAFVFATLLATFYPVFAIPAFIFAALVGVSRVMLGVHYPTDILAGAVLGLSSSWLVLWHNGWL